MFMNNLKRLHESMRRIPVAQGGPVERQRFRSVHGAVEFECIFFTGERPYKLSMTSRGTEARPSPEFFLFDVTEGSYEISGYFHDKYGRLADVLRVKDGASGQKLMPNEFLRQLDSNVPPGASVTAIPGPKEVIENRPDIVHERDAPYWSHWATPRSKADGSPGTVSAENRAKTATLMGSEALAYSDKMRLSSCWSPVETNSDWRGDIRV